jgi:YkoY family integral membrane protein
MTFFSELLNGLPIILSLIIIEGLLSVDNALAIAAMASELPGKQKKLALKLGIIGAYVFRGVALAFAGWIMANPWIKTAGAAYLIYLMCAHLTHAEQRKENPGHHKKRGFWMTVASIELMDLSLSVDNVVAAVALSPKLWLVCTGVFIGILALRFLAGACIGLLERYPILSYTAFLLVGYVGALLLFEIFTGLEIGSVVKFGGIALIIGATLAYEKNARIKQFFGPALRVILIPMRLYSGAVEFVFWPLRLLFTLAR